MTAAVFDDQVDLQRIVVRAFELIARNLALMTALTLILCGLPKLGASLIGATTAHLAAFPGAVLSLTAAAYGLIAALGWFALQAAVVHVAAADLSGAPKDIVASLRAGLRHLPAVLAVGVIAIVAISVGLALLLVPGLFLATAWLVAIPAAVSERLDVSSAFARSFALTRGARWRLLGLILAWALAGLLVHLTVSVQGGLFETFGMMNGVGRLVGDVTDDLIDAIGAMIGAALITSCYIELRLVHEGASPDELAELID